MSRRAHVTVAWIAGLALLAAHLWPWETTARPLLGGWLPPELALRLAWMAGAFLFLLHFCRCVWTDGDEPAARDAPDADGAPRG